MNFKNLICPKCSMKVCTNHEEVFCDRCGTKLVSENNFILEEATSKKIDLFSQGWQMEIQETEQFKDKNIIVLVNKLGKRLYMRAVKTMKLNASLTCNGKPVQDSFIELVPITKEEATENQINYEESMNESYFESEFEESVSEPQGEKIVHKFNSQSAEDMRKAAQTALEIANRLDKNNGAPVQESTETEKKDDLETVTAERNTYKEMLDLLSQQAFEKKKAQIHCDDPSIDSVDKLKAWSDGQKSATPKTVPAGNVPLSSQTPYEQKNEGYGTVQEMIQDVSDRAALGDVQAKQIMQKLLHKSLKGLAEGKAILPAYQEPEKEVIETSQFGADLKIVAKPDIGNITETFRRRKLKARAMRGDQQAQIILEQHEY